MGHEFNADKLYIPDVEINETIDSAASDALNSFFGVHKSVDSIAISTKFSLSQSGSDYGSGSSVLESLLARRNEFLKN